MFQESYHKFSKNPHPLVTCPFCLKYVYPGAHPEQIGHEGSVWCDNCEKMFELENNQS